jgi:hypothetical protein
LWQEFSDREVHLLRSLRDELSSKRWEMILDIDSAQTLLKTAHNRVEDRALQARLVRACELLDHVHRILARIPEDVIPAF